MPLKKPSADILAISTDYLIQNGQSEFILGRYGWYPGTECISGGDWDLQVPGPGMFPSVVHFWIDRRSSARVPGRIPPRRNLPAWGSRAGACRDPGMGRLSDSGFLMYNNCGNLFLQHRDLMHNDIPEDLKVHTKISMNQRIAESCNRFPVRYREL